jgi:hypothetical protein
MCRAEADASPERWQKHQSAANVPTAHLRDGHFRYSLSFALTGRSAEDFN